MEDEVWQTVIEIASSAARQVARDFRKWVEFDDLKQVACEYAIRRRDKVDEYLNRDDPDERRMGEAALTTFLRRVCERHARREKAKASGYAIDDEYFYRTELVESLIKVWGSGDYDISNQVLDPADMGAKRKSKLASEGNDLLAMISDIDSAMAQLHKHDRRTWAMVIARHSDEDTLTAIAEDYEVTAQRVDQLVKRGLIQIVDYLGGRNPWRK